LIGPDFPPPKGLSSSKTFLIEAGGSRFNGPVAEHFPELLDAAQSINPSANPFDNVAWDEITVGELASHMS
jgi:hypothetical protein